MTAISKPLAWLFGKLINVLYHCFAGMGIESVALSIFTLTLIIRLLLFPFNFNMSKSGRIQQFLKPEFDKINKKYKGKKDQQSMMKLNQESAALRKEYGIKQSTGCITMLIQLPVLWGVYEVFRNTDTYIQGASEKANYLFGMGSDFQNQFNLSIAPNANGWKHWTLMIPILSFVFQLLSMLVTPMQSTGDPQQDAQMKSMRNTMLIMPLFSFFICLSLPMGLGVYWISSALIGFLITLGTNIYFDHCDMERIVEKSKAKAAIKNAKDEAKGKKSFMDRMMENMYGSQDDSADDSENMAKYSSARLKNYTSPVDSDSDETEKPAVEYKKGSLASKANALARYNEKGENK